MRNLSWIGKDETLKFIGTGFLFLFQLLYLVGGYWARPALDDIGTPYDWTTPHCVLCLRYIEKRYKELELRVNLNIRYLTLSLSVSEILLLVPYFSTD